jgi:hypothetical protein
MINKTIINAFVDELEKISQLIAPASLPKGARVFPKGLPAPAQLAKGNVKYVPWESSVSRTKLLMKKPAGFIAKKILPLIRSAA